PTAEVVEVAPWQFRLAPGQDLSLEVGTIVFPTDASGTVTAMLVGNAPVVAWQRVAWYQTSTFNLILLALALLVLLAALITWPARLVRSLVRSPVARARWFPGARSPGQAPSVAPRGTAPSEDAVVAGDARGGVSAAVVATASAP